MAHWTAARRGEFVTGGRVERRLAAILAADVAGYSRLMGADEVGTLAALKAHRREVVDLAIAQHHGRIVKTTGASRGARAGRVRQRMCNNRTHAPIVGPRV